MGRAGVRENLYYFCENLHGIFSYIPAFLIEKFKILLDLMSEEGWKINPQKKSLHIQQKICILSQIVNLPIYLPTPHLLKVAHENKCRTKRKIKTLGKLFL